MKNNIDRRSFLKSGLAVAASGGLARALPSVTGSSSVEITENETLPDTLDLAERARLSVNALTNTVDGRFGWESDQTTHIDHRPPYMSWRASGPCLQKPLHALALMRIMSGSTQNADVDAKMANAIFQTISSDGLWWLKVDGHPWREGIFDGDQVWPVAQGRLIEALLDLNKYQYDPRRLEIVGRLAEGLHRIALRREDRAWYYTGYTRSGWREHVNPFSGKQAGANSMVFQADGGQVRDAKDEPATRPFFDIGLPLHGLAYWYDVSGDPHSLNVAQQLSNFMLKPAMWGNGEGPTLIAPEQHAIWSGHFHTHTMGAMGLLKYAVVTNDYGLKEFVASFYEYARNFGFSRVGFFPAVLAPLAQAKKAAAEYGGPTSTGQCDEGCAVADMTWLAVRLSLAGVGDYWDDVDQYVRNHLVEHQLTRRDLLESVVAAGPSHTVNSSLEAERTVDTVIGTFASGSDPTMAYAWGTMCCNANCAVALFEAWSSITRYRDGVAEVNLLLNRRSQWLDLESYLPFEGRVVIKNKTAKEVQVRLPGWVDKRSVVCRLNEKKISAKLIGNNVVVDNLRPKDTITIEYPMVETEQKYTDLSYETTYECRFRGNTLIDISPRALAPHYTRMSSDDGAVFPVTKGYPLYQRDSYKRGRAPTKQVDRYIASI